MIEEIFDQLAARGVAHAVVDVDAVAMCWPPGAGDRFNQRMAMRNLADVWRNYAAGGADRLVLARVLESRAELDDYRAAIPGADIRVCRLAASLPALRERIARRETGSSYESLVRRAAELAASMEQSNVADFVVETTGRTVRQAASEVLRKGRLDRCCRVGRKQSPARNRPIQGRGSGRLPETAGSLRLGSAGVVAGLVQKRIRPEQPGRTGCSADLRVRLGHVSWIGGGSGAGFKTMDADER